MTEAPGKHDPQILPPNIPAPQDDGATRGMKLPDLALAAIQRTRREVISSCSLRAGIRVSPSAPITTLSRLRLLICVGERLTATLILSGQSTAS